MRDLASLRKMGIDIAYTSALTSAEDKTLRQMSMKGLIKWIASDPVAYREYVRCLASNLLSVPPEHREYVLKQMSLNE